MLVKGKFATPAKKVRVQWKPEQKAKNGKAARLISPPSKGVTAERRSGDVVLGQVGRSYTPRPFGPPTSKTERIEVGIASYQPASAGSSLHPASAGVYKRVDSIRTARFSALSGGFSHVPAGGGAEASEKHAKARWKTGKVDIFLTPRLKPGAMRSRLKPADKAGSIRGMGRKSGPFNPLDE
jgi:hypothetical protein